MKNLTVTIFDGTEVTHWHEVTKVQFLEHHLDSDAYVLTFTNGSMSTLYGRLICVE